MNSIFAFLSRKPLLGFTGSLLSVSLTHLQILQIIGAALGIMIAVITAILKLIELKEKLAEKNKAKKRIVRKKKKPEDEEQTEE